MRRANLAALLAVICWVGLMPSRAFAGIIFDQSVDLTYRAYFSDPGSPQQIADDFQLQSGASTITDFHWWGVYAFSNTPTAPDNFLIRIFADISGAPDVVPIFEFVVGNVSRADTGTDEGGVFDGDVYAYFAEISPLALSANTKYWLSIINDTGADTDDNWAWAYDEPTGNPQISYRFLDGNAWLPFESRMGFQLTNDALTAVPEPASIALFVAGLLGLGWLDGRRKAR